MISLSIFSDFCSWWVFWWIAPFILGLALGAALWRGYKQRIAELEEANKRYKSSIYDMEGQVKTLKAEKNRCDVDLAEAKQIQKRLQKESDRLKRTALEKNVTSGLERNMTQQSKTLREATPGIAAGALTNKRPSDDHNPYSLLKPTNLQIIEGIGPKIESILKGSGIDNWTSLSKKSKGELRAILEKQGRRYTIIDPSSWPLQAHKASIAKWEDLISTQSEDGSESKLQKIMRMKKLR